MKTENTIGLVGLVAVIGLVAFFFARYDSKVIPAPVNLEVNVGSSTSGTNTTAATVGIPIADVVIHNVPADCWIIIRAKVYDVSNFLIQHPGGAARITPYCGADATTAFTTKDGTGSHSVIAESELVKLFIGEVQAYAIAAPANSNVQVITNTALNVNTTTSSASAGAATNITLDVATVAKHNRSSDCWITVGKGVYAVTGYLAKHPGGASRIIPYCGRDATTAFATQGGTGSHSSGASADLAALRLGMLGSSTTTKTITQVNANVTTLSPQGGEREDDDD